VAVKLHNSKSRVQANRAFTEWRRENISFIFLHSKRSGSALIARPEDSPLIAIPTKVG
jgi:hypothetical protein